MPPVLATRIFDETGNNVPPGIIAEMYINFGWLGLIIGMFAIGYLLRFVYNSFLNQHGSIIVQVIYAIIMVRMTVILFNSDFGTAMLKTIIDLVPLLLALWFVAEPKPKTVEKT